MTALQIDGATIIATPEGAELKYSWLPPQPISRDDVLKLRDWLNENYPVKPEKNADGD